MSEQDTQPPVPGPNEALTEEEIIRRLNEAADFVTDIAPHMGRLFGMDLNIRAGSSARDSAGMGTDPLSGDLVIDPKFFFEVGDGSTEAAEYGILHDTTSHIKRIINDPRTTEKINSFVASGASKEDVKARHLFINILEDVTGNNLIHAVLPRFKDVAHRIYKDQLFPDPDETKNPKHMQFVYKVLREAMVPDETSIVEPEVEAELAKLRNFEGQGDIIAYSTAVAKSATQALTTAERFTLWEEAIFPAYERLYEQDKQDGRFPEQDEPPGSGDQSSNGAENGQTSDQQQPQDGSGDQNPQQSGESENNTGENSQEGQQNPGENGQPQKPQNEGGEASKQHFSSYYQDYFERIHPEAMSDEDEKKLEEIVRQREEDGRRPSRPLSHESMLDNHESMLDKKLREETGHSLAEQRQYDAEIIKSRDAIDEMREVWQAVINERIAQKRGLSRRTFVEGAVLDPDRLVQTVIDVRNNIEPEAFRDYEVRKGQTESVGKTDYIFVYDISGSMNGPKAKAASTSAVIGLEGLAALQRDIEEAEKANGLDLELDIRTAMYTFGERAECIKPLSTKISPKERLDAYQALSSPGDGATRDFLALEAIEALPDETDRRRIVIVLSDGETYDPGGGSTSTRTRRSVDRLRGKGWFVYGISIGSDEAEQLYSPTARRVDDPNRIPGTIHSFIEATIS